MALGPPARPLACGALLRPQFIWSDEIRNGKSLLPLLYEPLQSPSPFLLCLLLLVVVCIMKQIPSLPFKPPPSSPVSTAATLFTHNSSSASFCHSRSNTNMHITYCGLLLQCCCWIRIPHFVCQCDHCFVATFF